MQSIGVAHNAGPRSAVRRTRVSLLDQDPDLGGLLRDEREASALRDVQVGLDEIASGEWEPAAHLSTSRCALGMLVISGAVVREITVDDEPSAELLGPGDLIRTATEDDPAGAAGKVTWTALTPCMMCALDAPATVALARYPEIMLALIERVETRARRLAFTQAISQKTGVDHRLQTLFWHLAERWGKVRPDGVLLPLDLSHQLLGKLVGARRPTVSTAVALLANDGRVTRCSDGSWLLHRVQPALEEPLEISHDEGPAWHWAAA